MTRRAFVAGAAAPAVGLLAACGAPPLKAATPTPGPAATAAPAPTPSARSGTLRLFLWVDDAEQATLAAVQAGFRAANPRATLDVTTSDRGSGYYDRLQTLAAAGTPPDAARLEPLWSPFLAAKGLLARLDGLLAAQRFPIADFWPALVAAYRWQGGHYALPERGSVQALVINPALFASAAVPEPNAADATRQWTWPTMLSAAQRLTRGAGATKQYGFAFDVTLGQLLPWIWANGGHMFTDDAKPVTLDLAYRNSVEAVQWLADTVARFHVAPSAAELSGGGAFPLFAKGKLAMYATTADIATIARQVGDRVAWDLAPLPVGAAGRFNIADGSGYAILAKAQASDLAWAFLAYVASATAQQRYATASGVAAIQAFSGPTWLATPPPAHRQPLVAGLEEAKPLPPSPALPQLTAEAIDPQLALLWSGKVDAQATLAAIDQKGAAVLAGVS